jgi:sulfur carrier protein ThiS
MMTDISVTVEHRGSATVVKLPEGSKVSDVLEQMKLFVDAHIVIRGKTPVPLNAEVMDGERLKVLKVASGG